MEIDPAHAFGLKIAADDEDGQGAGWGRLLVAVVYGCSGNLPVPLVPSRSETGRWMSVTPPQVAQFSRANGSHDEQEHAVEVSPEDHAGAVRSDCRADRRVLSATPQRRIPRTGPVHGGGAMPEATKPGGLGASALVGLRHHLRPWAGEFPVGQGHTALHDDGRCM